MARQPGEVAGDHVTARTAALTDDVRATIALRHLRESERAAGNADVYAEDARRSFSAHFAENARGWSEWHRAKAHEHVTEALAILPPPDGYEPPAPAFVQAVPFRCPNCGTHGYVCDPRCPAPRKAA